MRTLRFLLRKELLQIARDRVILRLIFVMPIIQLIILSSAATFEVKRARMYVVDLDRTELSRGLVDRLTASGRFVATGAGVSMELANEAMLSRDVDVIVRIPADFERDLVRTRTAPVQLVLNAEDGAAAGVTQSYAAQIVAGYAADLGVEVAPSLAGTRSTREVAPRRGQPNLELRARGWYNAELDYRDYMVPGILVQLVTIVGTMLTALNIVREKEIGTLDQLNVTPVTRGTFIAAKLLPMWAIAMLELALGLLVARFLFDVPMRGSIALVFLGAVIYLVAALGIGLFISTLVETQQQAMFVSFFVMMIYLLMSGLFTPVRSMPDWAQAMAQLNPVMHFIAMTRAIMLKGATLADVSQTLLILAAFGGGFVALAVRQYGKR
ncbi:MAG TPA: ABC transporter permease, partial [Vicinamibacterales bacterium]|nr:ABC transporter permease [Vicinamibacterales bacterium]